MLNFFFSSRRRHTRLQGDWSSDVCSSDLVPRPEGGVPSSIVSGAIFEESNGYVRIACPSCKSSSLFLTISRFRCCNLERRNTKVECVSTGANSQKDSRNVGRTSRILSFFV